MFDILDELAPSVGVVVQDGPPLPADLVDDDGGPDVLMPGPGDSVWDEPAPQVPPAGAGFDDLAPSGWLALELDSGTADPVARSKEDLVAAVIGFDRIASWAQARQARLLAELAERAARPDPQTNPRGIARGFLDGEIAVALKLSMGTAEVRLLEATQLCSVLPATLALWEAGRIDRPKVRAILDATAVLAPELAAKVESRVLPKAPQQSVAQLRAALARAVLAVDPEGANERHRHARKGRRVVVDDQQGEGMASLWALLAAHDAHAAYRWLTRLARALGADDPRSMDQRRADLLAELLSGRLVTAADVAVTNDDPDDAAENNAAEDNAAEDNAAEGGSSGEAGRAVHANRAGQVTDTTDAGTATAGPANTGPASTDAASTDTVSTDTVSTGTVSTGAASTGTAKPSMGSTATTSTGTAKPAAADTGTAEAGSGRGRKGRRGASLRPVTPGKPLIEVVMARSTLTGADDQPAELVGYGPIPACLAREIAADAVWRRLITDPLSGALLDYGRTTYRPPAALADFVRARDRYCRGPLCRQSAANCDLDHLQPWAEGGQTSEDNLNAFCGREHKLKDAPGWKIDVHPDGRLTWTTPTGHQLTTERWDYRPDPDPPPPPPPPIAPATALQGSTAPTAHDPDEDLPPF